VLAAFGVEVDPRRVVVDRNRITAGGVTAGIDFGLALVAQLCGENAARLTQLTMEYDPKPPFDAGSPEAAGPEITALARGFIEPVHALTLRIARTWLDQRASA
jgi:cyclohexyl-isocyanide hydratase